MSNLAAKEYKNFEDIKHVDENGSEYWLARELWSVLEYVEWRNFSKVLDRAMLACRNSGYEVAEHFFVVDKLVEMLLGHKQKMRVLLTSTKPKKKGLILVLLTT